MWSREIYVNWGTCEEKWTGVESLSLYTRDNPHHIASMYFIDDIPTPLKPCELCFQKEYISRETMERDPARSFYMSPFMTSP